MKQPPEVATPSPLTATALLLASSLTVMANATISASLPALADHFAATPGIRTLAGLVMTLPSLSVVLAAAVMGLLCDRLGRMKVLAASMLLYGFAGASGAFADGINGILVGRVFLGIANAGVMTASQALIADFWQGAARERFSGRQAAAMSLGGVVYLTLGGFLASLDWRYPFLVYLAALPMLPLVLLAIREPTRLKPEPGVGTGAFPWAFVLAISALAAFGMMIFYMIPVKLPFLMRDLGVDSPALAGIAVASTTVTSAATALAYGRLRARLSPPAIVAGAFAVMAAGYAIVGFAHSPAMAVAGVALSGIGLGVVMPNQIVWLMSRTPAHARGRAAGLMTTGVFLGQFVSPLVSGPIAAVSSLSVVYLVSAAALVIVAAAMAFLAVRTP